MFAERAPGVAKAAERPAVGSVRSVTTLGGPWEYRWERVGEAPSPWHQIDYPSNPPGREQERSLWLRHSLPPLLAKDAALFIPSVDTAFVARIDGRDIYSYGLPGGRFDGQFSGWPWHVIPLPQEAAGHEVEFHVFSNYRDIGLWGNVQIGDRNGIYLTMVRRDAPRFIVAAALCTIAILGALVFLFARERRAYALLATIVILMMFRVIGDSYLKQLLLNNPLMWQYIDAATAYFIPGFVAFFLVNIVVPPFNLVMKITGIVYLSAGAAGTLLSVAGVFPVFMLFNPSEILFGLFILTYLVSSAASLRNRGAEAAILLGTFLLMAIFNVHDILVARSILPWSDTTGHYMMFFFGCGLATLVAMRIASLHASVEVHAAQLSVTNRSLEQTVAERTRQLEQANKLLEEEKSRLEIVSTTDELTGLHNRRHLQDTLEHEIQISRRYRRPLSLVMMDLDFFKKLNDTFGHVDGDMVLRTVASIITGELRGIDFAARYGGEEFVILLPQTGTRGALRLAERIRAAVEGHPWPNGREVTISGGVASHRPAHTPPTAEDLIRAADEALYRAKNTGRNRVCR